MTAPTAGTAGTMADLLLRAYDRYGRHPALLTHDGAVTFAELGETVRRLAGGLAALGCRPGDRVVLALDNRPELVALEQAVFTAGLVRVAVSSRSHVEEIAYIARDCGARAVVCEPAHAAGLRLPGVVGFDDYPALLGPGGTEMGRVGPDDLAALLYTSGTTGRPKGAMVTHRAWVAMVAEFAAQLPPMGPGDVVLHTAPISHFGGSVGSAYAVRGAATATMRRFDPAETLRAVERQRVTALPLVPTMLRELTAVAEPGGFDLSSLRAVPYGGSALGAAGAARAHAVFGEVLYQFYGLSEALAPVSVLPARDHGHPAHRGSAGRFCPGVDYRITGDGELLLRGACVMTGYWNAPEQSAAVLRDGWFSTGDIGSVDTDGFLRIVDRTGDVIISGGFNVYPAEVERVIETLDGVREAAVLRVPHERWGEAVAAVVVRAPGGSVDAADVVRVCRDNLAAYKKPLLVEFADRLPYTGTGKVSRRELRERYWPAADAPADAPTEATADAPTDAPTDGGR